MRFIVLAALATEGPQTHALRRASVQMSSVLALVRPFQRPETAYSQAHRREALQMRRLSGHVLLAIAAPEDAYAHHTRHGQNVSVRWLSDLLQDQKRTSVAHLRLLGIDSDGGDEHSRNTDISKERPRCGYGTSAAAAAAGVTGTASQTTNRKTHTDAFVCGRFAEAHHDRGAPEAARLREGAD